MQGAILLFSVVLCVLQVALGQLIPNIGTVENYQLLKTGKYGSKLYQLKMKSSSYADDEPYLLNLTSDSYEAGFDSGALFGKEYISNIEALFTSMIGDQWYEKEAQSLVFHFLDKQYEFLSEQLPEEYKKEFAGLSAGGESVGLTGFTNDVGKIAQRGLVLANFPGTLSNLKYIIAGEKKRQFHDKHADDILMSRALDWLITHAKDLKGFQCSNFGVWGSRTVGGELYSGRNLDWLKDTGVARNKLITVHRPVGGNAHADFGFAGMWGAVTGLSSKGLTVHEANLESDDISFFGFPWLLRLRSIMAYSDNLESAIDLWKQSNNTVGFNHGVGSASDKQSVLMETMAHNTAFFGAMDPREANAPNGAPRIDAVYRTNHGYDPYTIEHYMWNNTGAYQNSQFRYNLFPVVLDAYAATNTAISAIQAINMTAIAGEKGENEAYECTGSYPDGANILSATFYPKELTAYIAWESGTGETWTPAACSTYIEVNLKPFFDRL